MLGNEGTLLLQTLRLGPWHPIVEDDALILKVRVDGHLATTVVDSASEGIAMTTPLVLGVASSLVVVLVDGH